MPNVNVYGVFDKIIYNVPLIDWDHAKVKMCVISVPFIPNIFPFDKYGKIMREMPENSRVQHSAVSVISGWL
jgi:hypothetical protein